VCEDCINEYCTNNFYIYAEEWWVNEIHQGLLPRK
jgi:hypothetical protein